MGNPKEKHEEQAELIRIKGSDVDARKQLIVGLTKIKGISWAFANAMCRVLKISPTKRISELDKDEVSKIEGFIDNPEVPAFLKNRQKDFDSGEDSHLNGSDLKLKGEFDIKRLKKVKAYRGIRHSSNLPTRGQRTKSNFRRNRKKSGAVGVKTKKK